MNNQPISEALAKMPKSIRVAAFDFEMKPWTAHDGSDKRRFGECSCYMQEIRIDTSLKRTQVLDTILHELNHAIFWAYNLDDDDKEERTVGTFATAWVQVYRDNPKLLEFIKWATQEGDGDV